MAKKLGSEARLFCLNADGGALEKFLRVRFAEPIDVDASAAKVMI